MRLAVLTVLASLVLTGCAARPDNHVEMVVEFSRPGVPDRQSMYVCAWLEAEPGAGERYTCIEYGDFVKALQQVGGVVPAPSGPSSTVEL